MSETIDKAVVITGASSGIGTETAELLAASGAKVVLSARRKDRLDALAARIRDAGGDAFAVESDVTDPAQMKAVAETAVGTYGRSRCAR